MDQKTILVRYNEIGLKGANRAWFENSLLHNLKAHLKRVYHSIPSLGMSAEEVNTCIEISKTRGRIFLKTPWFPATQEAFSEVFGISSYSPVLSVPTDKDLISKAIIDELKAIKNLDGKTFKVQVRRSEKALPQNSMALEKDFGADVLNHISGLTVNLSNPDILVGIEIREKNSYLFTSKFQGPGGLPVGTNGVLLSLLSGGIDSPVASIQMMKRGPRCHMIHFSGTPFVGDEVQEKVEKLSKLVNRYQIGPGYLFVVPFGKIQEKVALSVNAKYRTLIYRRLMIRIANRIAFKNKCDGLVTGESLGQVASQTLQNLSRTNEISDLPVFRPLIGMDKSEIIEIANRFGTFTTSIEKGEDCCTLFADRHPVLNAKKETVEEIEANVDIASLVQEGVSQCEKKYINPFIAKT